MLMVPPLVEKQEACAELRVYRVLTDLLYYRHFEPGAAVNEMRPVSNDRNGNKGFSWSKSWGGEMRKAAVHISSKVTNARGPRLLSNQPRSVLIRGDATAPATSRRLG